MTTSNLYEDLGVSKDADKATIKKAYRKAAHKHHPDRQGGNAEKFHAVTRAYDILYDDARRAHYDTHGTDGLQDRRGHLMQRLAALFMQLVEQNDVDHTDIVALMQQALLEGKKTVEKAIADQQKKIAKYERAKKRLTKKGSGDNLFVQMLDGQISLCKRGMENGKDELTKADEMLEIVKDYQYHANAGRPTPQMMSLADLAAGMQWGR